MNLVRRNITLLSAALFCAGLAAQPLPADHADAAAARAVAPAPGTLDSDSCIEVEVNGEKVPSFACLTLKLKPAPHTQATGPAPPAFGSESIVQKPGNQLGLFNRAATSHRMGNAFGNSVTPQRPAR